MACHELLLLPSLSNLDLRDNQIEDRENVVPFFSKLQSLTALYLKGNPSIRHISKYRKTLTANIKQLNYLDDRPVFEIERLCADAWLRGGEEEERRVKQEYQEKKQNQTKSFLRFAREHEEEGKKRRKEYMKRMIEELKHEKEGKLKKRQELKEEYDDTPVEDPQRPYILSKIRQIDDELQTEFYKVLEEKGEEIPKRPETKLPEGIDDEYRKKLKEDEERIKQIKKEYEMEQRDLYHEELKARQKEINQSELTQANDLPDHLQDHDSGSAKSETEAPSLVKSKFDWTPNAEELLEDILITKCFDFSATT
jgi:dynein assembly factor 1